MQCPYCDGDSNVTETRLSPDGLRRRRVCTQCKRRFTTYERHGGPGLKVEKRDGSVEPFDPAKLLKSLERVSRGRPGTRADTLQRIARDIEASLVDSGEKSVRWSQIVVQALRRLDGVDRLAAARLRANYLDEVGTLRLDDGAEEPASVPQLGLPGVGDD